MAAVTGAVRPAFAQDGADMYGLIGKMTALAGKRDELIAILLAGVGEMPGCLSYIVATDPADANAIWITEAWDSKASHDASLSLPHTEQACAEVLSLPLHPGLADGDIARVAGEVHGFFGR